MKKIFSLLILLVLVNTTQSTNALSVVDTTTCSKFTENISFKDNLSKVKRAQIQEVQESLASAGYFKVTPNGYFGPLTFKAVKSYQKDNGITQTGFIGEKTRAALKSQFCSIEENYICDYAAPPEGCTYVAGENYNSKTQCGMVLKCDGNQEEPASNSNENCKVWNDGCNTCSKTSPKGLEMCTLKACSQDSMTKPYCMEYFDNQISDTCKSWNDGCNSCARSEIGGNGACTKMACSEKKQPYCKEYFKESKKTCLESGKTYREGETTDCITINGSKACIADATHVCRDGKWKIEGGLPMTKLIQACPTEKIINKMPIACVKAPCNTTSEEYYIHKGIRQEIALFDASWVKNNCIVKESVVY